MSVIPTKKKLNACYGKSETTDSIIFKECFVQDVIRTLPVDQVWIDGTMSTVRESTSTLMQKWMPSTVQPSKI